MRLSKLERYYQAEFGPREPDEVDEVRPARDHRLDREDRPVGSARGAFGGFKLLLLLGSMGFFAASFLMPCGYGSRPTFLPQGLVSAVCARQEVTGQLFDLEGRFRTISNALR